MTDPSRRRPGDGRRKAAAARQVPAGTSARRDQFAATIAHYARFLVENVLFTPEDERALRAFHGAAGSRLPEVVEDFYLMIEQQEALRRILGPDPAVLRRLKVSFRRWLDEILAEPHDAKQIRRHLRIGDKHVEIGLENRFLLVAFQRVRSALLGLRDPASPGRLDLERSLDKILMFEAALLTDGYSNRRIADVVEQREAKERRLLARESDLTRQVSLAQERFFSILQNPIALILVVEPQGRVLLFNGAAEQTLGFTAAEVVDAGRFVEVLVSEGDRSLVERHLQRVFLGEKVPLLQWGALDRRGRRIELASTFFPTTDATDRPLCAILALDVTEQARLREELSRAESLATIGRLAAMVAHEVGNPLAGMKGVLEIVRGRLAAVSEEALLLGRVLERIDELAGLIRDLLVMARPVEVHQVQTPLSLFLHDVSGSLDAQNDLLGCRLYVSCDPSDLSVHVDPGQLRRAVTNLLLNAAQAAGRDGSIRLVGALHGDVVWIDVEDNGLGIPEPVMLQLFTPFFTTKRGGTGLGLSISREIVRKHGGDLIASNLGVGGARFRIILPQVKRT